MGKRKHLNKTNSSPLVSVIVPVYNRKEWIPFTLQSLRDQTYKNIEVCVCNDGGDSIDDILQQFEDLNIIYTEHEKNKGLPAARNTALRSCSGDFISLLDSDDIYLPLALEFRLSMLKKYSAECVYTRALQNIFEKRKDQSGREVYQIVHQQLYWQANFDRDQLLWMNLCPCNCWTISRRAWEESNYWFDEELKTGEDYDFTIAISRRFDYIDLKLIDCEDSYRNEAGGQMTGQRNFAADLPRIYGRWRKTAKNLPLVVANQNAILKNAGINPSDYGL
jgi:glycosyltransferase involved in cell wall biosynthesis